MAPFFLFPLYLRLAFVSGHYALQKAVIFSLLLSQKFLAGVHASFLQIWSQCSRHPNLGALCGNAARRNSTKISLSCKRARIIQPRHGQRRQHHLTADHAENTSHVIATSPVHWRADCCLATSCKHSSCCCVRVLRGVYRAVAWHCLDMSQYFIQYEHYE
jgi:hypothetical protein